MGRLNMVYLIHHVFRMFSALEERVDSQQKQRSEVDLIVDKPTECLLPTF